MRRILAALVATTAIWIAVPAEAVTFQFSFTNVGNGGGLVEGLVGNLVNNAIGPGEVEIISNTRGFGIGPYMGGDNLFTVTNYVITDVSFLALGENNPNSATGCCSLLLGPRGDAGLSSVPVLPGHALNANLTFWTNVAQVPLPAPFALLAAGLALLAAVGWRRRRAPA